MGSGISSSYSGAGGSRPYDETYHVVNKEPTKDKQDHDIYISLSEYFKNPTATELEDAVQGYSIYIDGRRCFHSGSIISSWNARHQKM